MSALLGTPLAGAACKQTRQGFPGEVRGAAHDVGHRLRDAWYERASGEPERVGVAIVGAGPAGLSAGWRLARSEFRDYRIFDLEPVVGGTSTYGTDGIVPYPWGAHYVPVPLEDNRALRILLDEMGILVPKAGAPLSDSPPTARERFRIREPEERLFIDGLWQAGLFPAAGASPQDWAELRAFEQRVDHWVDVKDGQGRRAFALPIRTASDDARFAELDRVSAAEWLKRQGIRSSRVLWYLDLACRDDYGLNLEQTSAWALLFYFCARRRAGGGGSQPFVSWPEGNGRLVQHLARHSEGRIRTGSLVTDVVPEEHQVRLAVYDAVTGKLQPIVAEHVILALPQFVAGRVLRPWRDKRPPHLAEFSYGPWLVANLHLKESPKQRGAPLAWDNVLFDSPSLGYVSARHQALRDLGPDVWTYYLPLTGADPSQERKRLLDGDHATWSRAVMADLSQAHPDLDDQLERIDLYKWGHGMVRPTPGFMLGAARRTAVNASLERVHFAHSDLSGIALFEEAQDRGVLAAERVLGRLGKPVTPLAG